MSNTKTVNNKNKGVIIILTSFLVSILFFAIIFLFMVKNDFKEAKNKPLENISSENTIADSNNQVQSASQITIDSKQNVVVSTSSQENTSNTESNKKTDVVAAPLPKTEEEFEKSMSVTPEETHSSQNTSPATTGDIVY